MRKDGARLLCAWVACAPILLAQTARTAQQNSAGSQRAVLDKYCVTCHNQQANTVAGLKLDRADLNNIPGSPELWEKVIRRIRAGTMPPLGMPRPDQQTSDNLASFLEPAIDRAAALHPTPHSPGMSPREKKTAIG